MGPVIVKPFSTEVLTEIREHVRHVRRCFDWPGIPYHDVHQPSQNRFNRWSWHNLPMLRNLHHHPKFVEITSQLFGVNLKPSYVFLSMYGSDGVCPPHTDRPQCQFTIDLQIDSNGTWPIYVCDKPYELKNGEALAYSGTGHLHYRKPMNQDGTAKFMNLAFFHFVPSDWTGSLD